MLVAQPPVQACHCHRTEALNQEASSSICHDRSTRALLQHVPEPASYQPGIALSSRMSLGELQGFLPRITNSPNPNQQSPRPSCLPQLAGAKKAKADVKAPQDTTSRDFWVGQALGSSSSIWSTYHLEHLQHLSPSRTECPDLAGRQPLEGNHFSISFFQKEHFKVSSYQNILSFSTRPSPTWLSSRQATMTGPAGQHFEMQQGATWR